MERNHIVYRGEVYELTVIADRGAWRTEIFLDKEEKEITVRLLDGNPAFVQNVMLNWFYREAYAAVREKIDFYRPVIGRTVGRIRIKDQRTRWGSCSSKGNLNFNWRLILLPPDLLEYVVVHEMCHLKEMNHSPAFWLEVEQILPDYSRRRKILREWREPPRESAFEG